MDLGHGPAVERTGHFLSNQTSVTFSNVESQHGEELDCRLPVCSLLMMIGTSERAAGVVGLNKNSGALVCVIPSLIDG